METIKEMQERHEKEIGELQENCKHKKISNWMDFMWAPGHFCGRVKVCEICGKVIERDEPKMPESETTWSGSDREYRIAIDATLEREDLDRRTLERPSKPLKSRR